ncbi:unnamed protein product [Parnassius apollo]|uniref:(apollo) hypothetical protein n=1 Tax=Parnassius apollo TaxID=110799 RepID=A0A8S3XM02_PARAO|nr:unnamed protein product [Parnassius apollo]
MVIDGFSSIKRRCILPQLAKPPTSPPFALKYDRNAFVFILMVHRMRRTPPAVGVDCWACEDPADTKQAGGDDGCEGYWVIVQHLALGWVFASSASYIRALVTSRQRPFARCSVFHHPY